MVRSAVAGSLKDKKAQSAARSRRAAALRSADSEELGPRDRGPRRHEGYAAGPRGVWVCDPDHSYPG
jgi:hypothetical protein